MTEDNAKPSTKYDDKSPASVPGFAGRKDLRPSAAVLAHLPSGKRRAAVASSTRARG